jgi:hypothetical protein
MNPAERSRLWKLKNPEKAKENCRRYYIRHADEIKEREKIYRKKYYAENRDILIEKRRADYQRNPEKYRAYSKKYWQITKAITKNRQDILKAMPVDDLLAHVGYYSENR